MIWAALRSGLYLTPINRFLNAEEAAYILADSEAKALVTSLALADTAAAALTHVSDCGLRLVVGGKADGFDNYDVALGRHPPTPLADQPRGEIMVYSSGTTGRPKGIKRPLSGRSIDTATPLTSVLQGLMVSAPTPSTGRPLLSTTGPARVLHTVQAHGGTVVCLEHFDPVEALAAVEEHRVTHSQWVPTMFVRMLKAGAEVRDRYDLSSMRYATHAAAPCPLLVKQQMFEWWGPIIHEYYAGTEGNGLTYATPEDWLAHPGTVGRPLSGVIHICDPDGAEVATGEVGTIFFEQPVVAFEYHNDSVKTRTGQHPAHSNWSTLGDIGYVDEDGFLFLTDRQAFMIISGGVNIYPQKIEDCLVLHDAVADVAVIGVPDDEMGESVKAIVQPSPGIEPSNAVGKALIAHCRAHLAGYKIPRSVDFVAELPRLATGKLFKQDLRALLAG